MKVHYGIDSLKEIKNPIITVGTFDGVHLGHQKIIERLKKLANKTHGETVLLTFNPHPRKVLLNDQNLKLINYAYKSPSATSLSHEVPSVKCLIN